MSPVNGQCHIGDEQLVFATLLSNRHSISEKGHFGLSQTKQKERKGAYQRGNLCIQSNRLSKKSFAFLGWLIGNENEYESKNFPDISLLFLQMSNSICQEP